MGEEARLEKANLNLVFTEISGRPMRMDTLSHRFARECRRRGYPHIRLYDLRHLAASMIRDVGGLDAARRTLGHSSIRLVAETYGYELESTSRSVAQGIEHLLWPGTPSDTSRSVPPHTASLPKRARNRAKLPEPAAVS